jgi:hypothetical protein
MAEDTKKKSESKAKPAAKPAAAKPAAPKAAEKSAEAPAAKAAAAKPAAAKADKADAKARGKATPAVTDGPHCRADKCKQPIRAKGYCRKHYVAWRRGETGDHHRYKVCSKEGCRKPRAKGGLCDEHAGTAAPESAPAAAPAGGEGGATA